MGSFSNNFTNNFSVTVLAPLIPEIIRNVSAQDRTKSFSATDASKILNQQDKSIILESS